MTEYEYDAADNLGGPRWRGLVGGLAILAVLVGLVWAINYGMVGAATAKALEDDPRNQAFELRGRFQYWIFPLVLVLDLREPGDTDPVDLFRGVLQVAVSNADGGGQFQKVLLMRRRTVVFQIDGRSFQRLGRVLEPGETEMDRIRTVPETLRSTVGVPAYGETVRPMEDLTDAATRWITGGVR